MGQRGKQEWSKEGLPIGSVRLRKRKPRGAGKVHRVVRQIKIRDDGPKGAKWVNFARWLWEQNRGPIPAGMRVVHRDLDSLNDDPENLILASAGDVAYLCHAADPEMSRRNFAKMRIGTARANRDRANLHRRIYFLPASWYAVELRRRLIVNNPRRCRWQTIADLGLAFAAGDDDASIAAGLGWPQAGVLGACVMHVLLERGPLTTGDALAAVNELRAELGRRPLGRGSFASAICDLKRRGELIGSRAWLELPAGAAPAHACRFTGVRGHRLSTEARWCDFEKVERNPVE